MNLQLNQISNCLILFLILLLFTQSCSLNGQGNLSVEAGLIYGAGNVKPVARTDFYLLDVDLETILKNAQLPIYWGMTQQMKDLNPTQLQNYLFILKVKAKRAEIGYEGETDKELLDMAIYKQIDSILEPHIVSKVTTDFSGKTQFQNVKNGKYYLMGTTVGPSTEVILWNLPIEVKSENQTIILDNRNTKMVL
jgi:hypothetical protein